MISHYEDVNEVRVGAHNWVWRVRFIWHNFLLLMIYHQITHFYCLQLNNSVFPIYSHLKQSPYWDFYECSNSKTCSPCVGSALVTSNVRLSLSNPHRHGRAALCPDVFRCWYLSKKEGGRRRGRGCHMRQSGNLISSTESPISGTANDAETERGSESSWLRQWRTIGSISV